MLRKRFFLLLSLYLFCFCFTFAQEWVSDQIAVRFQDFVGENDVKEFESDFSTYNLHEASFSSNRLRYRTFEFDDKIINAENILALVKNSRYVEYASLCLIYKTQEDPNDFYFPYQWSLKNIGQDLSFIGLVGGDSDCDIDIIPAWELIGSSTGSNERVIEVAILDQGLRMDHEDLLNNFSSFRWNYLNDDDILDIQYHGTGVAGVIAAEANNNSTGISGLSYQNRIKVMPLQVGISSSYDELYINGNHVNNAMYDVLQKRIEYNESGGDAGNFVVAVNLSYGDHSIGQPDGNSMAPFIALGEAGILIVAAAGNTGLDLDYSSPFYPASLSISIPYVISVTGTTPTDSQEPYTNWGKST